MNDRAIVMLARAPSAAGKTRLTTGLTEDQARTLREALLLDTLDAARTLNIPILIYYTPDDAEREMTALVGDLPLSRQVGGDLGGRMMHAIFEGLAWGFDRAVAIGSDVPSLPPSSLIDAFDALEAGADCVFGPAEDGGYYLLGVTWGPDDSVERGLRLRELFVNIDWGGHHVLQQSLAAAHASRLRTALVAPWFDVDVPDDLARVVSGSPSVIAPRTRACVSAITLLQRPAGR